MNDETNEIDELVRQCNKGNSGAQQQLYDRLASKLFAICLRYAKDRDEAKDILQDGFIRIFTKLKSFKFNGSFEGWAYRIVVNCAIERFRRTNLLYTVDEIRNYDTQLAAADVLSQISYDELLQMVHQLTPQYRTVFNLYAIEGYSHQEIGKMLNISENTSKSNLSRARGILQEKVEQLYGKRRNNTEILN